jgi:hypothetical protein
MGATSRRRCRRMDLRTTVEEPELIDAPSPLPGPISPSSS